MKVKGFTVMICFLISITAGAQLHTLPVASFSSNTQKACTNGQVTFINTSASDTTQKWIFQNGEPATSTADTVNVTYPVAGNFAVTLIAINSSGTDTLIMPGYITVYNLPLVYTTTPDVTVCRDTSANLSAHGAATYTWTPSAGLSDTTIFNPVATPLVTTTYIVTGTDTNNCVNTASVLITVDTAQTLYLGPDTAVCYGSPVTLTVPNGFTGYVWSTGDHSQSITVYQTAFYYVTATQNGCPTNDSIGVYEINCSVGINTISDNKGFDIYPNPSTGRFCFKGITSGNTLEVYDVLGRCIYSGIAGGDNYVLNISSQAKGVYLYRVADTNGTVQVGKMIVE